MRKKYRNYSDQDIIDNAKKVKSLSGLLISLDLKVTGGNFANMKRNLQRLNVDSSHWTGKAWNRNQRLKDWSRYNKSDCLKKHLIKDRGNICECCLLDKWLDSTILLEIHHVDGDRTNNELNNLKLLCPNCHSQTDNWRGKKNKQ